MKRKALLAAVGLLWAVSGTAQHTTVGMAPTANTDSLIKHIRTLASESCEGRMAGTAGYDRAAAYVKRTLASYGVADIDEQAFTVECNEVENCKFNTYLPGEDNKRTFTLGNEFCCAGMTGRGYVDAQMVFCGYGIDNGAMDEYKDVDVQGKVVVVLTGLPSNCPLPKDIASHYASLRDKARTAEKHGAVGMLAVNLNKGCLPFMPQGRVYCGELPHLATFPMLQLTLDCGRELLEGEHLSLDSAIAHLNKSLKPQSFPLRKKTEIDVNARYQPKARTTNIVAVVKGSDRALSREYIVVGASLDGVGMQGATCLFPGADINASGVASLLEAARLLQTEEFRPRRSIVFVFFGGDEHQYLGSRTFLEFFPKPRRIEAFVNVQNTGHGDSLVVLGNNHYPALYDIASTCDSVSGRHSISHSAEPTNPRGDARIFDAIGIPSLVITTHNGMHHNRVSSDIWENIDSRILTAGAQLLVETLTKLGDGSYQGRSPKSRAMRL